VQMADDLFGKGLVVAVQEAESHEAGDKAARPFEGFKDGNGAEGFVGG